MGRAGQGNSSNSSSSGNRSASGRSSGSRPARTSGGHQVSRPSSSSSRPSGSSSNVTRSSSRGTTHGPGEYNHHDHYDHYDHHHDHYDHYDHHHDHYDHYHDHYDHRYQRGYRTHQRSYRRSSGVNWANLIAVILFLVVIVVFVVVGNIVDSIRDKNRNKNQSGQANSNVRQEEIQENYHEDNNFISEGSGSENIYNRVKLDSGIPYNSDCIVDEMGWFEDEGQVKRELEAFYDKTGIQPYVVILEYHSELKTEEDKIAFCEDWYDENIDNEATFLFMYFSEKNAEEDVGYMTFTSGTMVDGIMDSKACDIFWEKMDYYWFSDCTMNEVIINTFIETADEIM